MPLLLQRLVGLFAAGDDGSKLRASLLESFGLVLLKDEAGR
jgi:hypothetical protein